MLSLLLIIWSIGIVLVFFNIIFLIDIFKLWEYNVWKLMCKCNCYCGSRKNDNWDIVEGGFELLIKRINVNLKIGIYCVVLVLWVLLMSFVIVLNI